MSISLPVDLVDDPDFSWFKTLSLIQMFTHAAQLPYQRGHLHLLLYYTQAWSLVWTKRPILSQAFQAGPKGPRYEGLKGPEPELVIPSPDLIPRLTVSEFETILSVAKTYGHFTYPELQRLCQAEPPWKRARVGLSEADPGNDAWISLKDMEAYYRVLDANANHVTFDLPGREG